MTPAGLMVTNDSQLPEKQNEELSTDNKLPCNDLDCVITDSGVVVSHLQVHHSGPRSKFSDNLEGIHFEPFRCDPRLFSLAIFFSYFEYGNGWKVPLVAASAALAVYGSSCWILEYHFAWMNKKQSRKKIGNDTELQRLLVVPPKQESEISIPSQQHYLSSSASNLVEIIDNTVVSNPSWMNPNQQ